MLSPVKVIFVFAISGLALCKVGLALPSIRLDDSSTDIRFVNVVNRYDTSTTDMIQMDKTSSARGQYSYTIGQRITGDKLVDQQSDSGNYPAARDVEVTLNYPKSGTGLILSHVNILVSQSSEDGDAFVISGGVNKKFVEILVVANQTSHFSYSAAYYGY